MISKISNVSKGGHELHSEKEIKNQGYLVDLATVEGEIRIRMRKQKQKSMMAIQPRQKMINQSSSKSFRIKNKTVSVVKNHCQPNLLNKSILQIIKKVGNKKKQQITPLKSISSDKQKIISQTNILPSQLQVTNKVSNIVQKDKIQTNKKKCQLFRRAKFQNTFRNQSNEQNNTSGKIGAEISKYGITDVNCQHIKKQQDKQIYKIYIGDKNKFRKGKYQLPYSSNKSNKIINKISKTNKTTKSQHNIQVQKQQQNNSIFLINNITDDKQLERDDRRQKNKQRQKKLQKCSQRYFEFQNSWNLSKNINDIAFFLNTIKTPTIPTSSNKDNHHQLPKKYIDYQIPQNKINQNHLLTYDFDFNCIQNQCNLKVNSVKQDKVEKKQKSQFQQQRKIVQRQHFLKKISHWNQSDCRIDQA